MCSAHWCVLQGLNTLDRAGIHDGEVFVRLLTNRAACHLSLARPLSALKDCHMAVEVSQLLPAQFFCCTVSHGHSCTKQDMSGCISLLISQSACPLLLSVHVRLIHGCSEHSTQLSSIFHSLTSCFGCIVNCIINCSACLSSHQRAVFALVWYLSIGNRPQLS